MDILDDIDHMNVPEDIDHDVPDDVDHMDVTQDIDRAIARYAALVDREIRRVLDAHAAPHDFYGMLRYHLGWVDQRFEPVAAAHGKGLRAALLLLVSDACGGDEAVAVPLAAAVDLLHNFSLIHDDIEDGSATRRHRPTLWSLWGEPLSINAGDGLYAITHLTLYESPLRHSAPGRLIELARRFERTALHLCEGQHLDMSFETAANVTVDDYLRMIDGKSAALIAAAAWMGAYAAGAGEEQAEAAHRFGRELGLAFQMQDDVLGIWGDERVTGKSASSDVAARKKTLPVLLALEHAAPGPRERLRQLYARHDGGDDAVAEIVSILDAAEARGLASGYLARHRDAAFEALGAMGLPPAARERVSRFARRFVERVA